MQIYVWNEDVGREREKGAKKGREGGEKWERRGGGRERKGERREGDIVGEGMYGEF